MIGEVSRLKAELHNMTCYKDQIDAERKQLFKANTKNIAELNAANEKLRFSEQQILDARAVLIDYGEHHPTLERVLREARLKLVPLPTPSEVSDT